jgi:PX domain
MCVVVCVVRDANLAFSLDLVVWFGVTRFLLCVYFAWFFFFKNMDVQGPTIETTRRFSDFVWLHEKLTKKHPECAIPPIPEKDFNLMSKFTDEFLDYRARELERFLKRVSAHSKLSAAACVHSFFNADVEVGIHRISR